jgi:signal transduction histidine kinase
MERTGRLPARRREAAALGVGLLSAVVLTAAALAPFSDPELAGRAAFAQTAGRTADAVVQEWERMLREDDLPESGPEGRFVWDSGPLPQPLEPRVEAGAAGAESSAFRALMQEARRVEVDAGDVREALEVVLEALQKPAERPERATARLRAIQLAVRLDRDEVAREQWRAATTELEGNEVCGELPCLLAAALAWAPKAGEDERATIAARTVELWTAGALALPDEGAELTEEASALRRNPSPLRDALAARVDSLAPGAGLLPGIERYEDSRAAAMLRQRLGGSLPERPATSGWSVEDRGGTLLAVRARPDGAVEARSLDAAELAARLRERLERYSLVPPGFELDFAGDEDDAGLAVRERIVLAGPRFGATLRHRDPGSAESEESRRLALVRGALLVLALLCAGGGFATFRALRRERRLAELRSAFVANVSHELRTPVASILLMADNLEQGRGGEGAGRYPELIRREAARLRRLVDDVLDFSRLERGRELDLRLEEIDLRSLVSALGDEARAWAARNGMEVAIELGGDLPESALLDGEAVRRAVFNLLDNALRHSGSKSVELAARARDGKLVLSVRDHGKGVPSRHRAAIFEPFERGTANGSPGAGLGLAIVRSIAEGHGGSATARDADPGPGMEFEVRLPLAHAPAEASGEPR